MSEPTPRVSRTDTERLDFILKFFSVDDTSDDWVEPDVMVNGGDLEMAITGGICEATEELKFTNDKKANYRLLLDKAMEFSEQGGGINPQNDRSKTNRPQIGKPSHQVTLSTWGWHHLLREMEHLLQIVNRDNNNCKALYCEIASQLAGHPVIFSEPKPEPPKPQDPSPEEKPGIWKRFFGRRKRQLNENSVSV